MSCLLVRRLALQPWIGLSRSGASSFSLKQWTCKLTIGPAPIGPITTKMPFYRCEKELKEDIDSLYSTAIESVLPLNMVHKSLHVSEGNLIVNNIEYPLNRNVHIIGFGKAVLGMVRAVEEILGDHIVGGIVSVPDGIQETFRKAGKT